MWADQLKTEWSLSSLEGTHLLREKCFPLSPWMIISFKRMPFFIWPKEPTKFTNIILAKFPLAEKFSVSTKFVNVQICKWMKLSSFLAIVSCPCLHVPRWFEMPKTLCFAFCAWNTYHDFTALTRACLCLYRLLKDDDWVENLIGAVSHECFHNKNISKWTGNWSAPSRS